MPYHLMKIPLLIVKSRINQFPQMGNKNDDQNVTIFFEVHNHIMDKRF